MKAKDLTGKEFNGNTVLRQVGSDGRRSLWAVRCAHCGREFTLSSSEIQKGRQRSCGCARSKLISEKRSRHGMSNTPIWNIWHSMKERCETPTAQAWKNYGGRGIRVCRNWSESFEQFLADMGSTYRKGLTLDRIDVNGDYCPENCRWVTMKEQARNKRNNVRIDTPKGRMTVAEASEIFGIGKTTIHYRLAHGVPENMLLTAPNTRNRFMTSETQARITAST